MSRNHFALFSKPFILALRETFEVMVQTQVTPHSPKLKRVLSCHGDITAIIGMNGKVERDGTEKEIKGLLSLTWPEDVYIKHAGKMLFDEFDEYCDEIADTGAEIVNIVMGNAKNEIARMGYKIEMATPSTIRGKNHEIKYPQNSTVVEITMSTEEGDIQLEICYQEEP